MMVNIISNIDFNYLNVVKNKIMNKETLCVDEINYFLECLVYETRKLLYDGDIFFCYKCDKAQKIICDYLDYFNICNYPNTTNNAITNYIVGHNFVVATFNINNSSVNYLIDPTYIQFFKKENCNSKCYHKCNNFIIKTPDPGYFIKEDDKDYINNFNYYGFGILDDRLAKIYGDSFYNTKTMVTNKEFKEIDGKVYINSFLKFNDKFMKSDSFDKKLVKSMI